MLCIILAVLKLTPLKKLSIILWAILSCHLVSAQFKLIAQSTAFDEPEKGFSKLLQLKNGYTLFFHITAKEGFEVKVFDDRHKLKATRHHAPSYGKLKYPAMEGLFEVKGDGVLLISELDAKIPTLWRIIVDGKTGQVKESRQIAELHKLNSPAKMAVVFGGVPMPDFFIRKDPATDCYALAMFNSLENDRNQRIEVIHYGSEHQELSHAFYTSPEEGKYKYMHYLDMAVIGSQSVNILANAYNTRASGGREKELVLADLRSGQKEVTLTMLDFAKDLDLAGGIVRYNQVSKKLIMLATTKKKKKSDDINSLLAIIDPWSRKLEKNEDILPGQAVQKNMEIFGKKDDFTGTPQNLFINNDGGFTVLFEEIENMSKTYGTNGLPTPKSQLYYDERIGLVDKSAVMGGKGETVIAVRLSNMVINNYNAAGTVTNSYFVPKSHLVTNRWMKPFYHSERQHMGQKLEFGNQFKSFTYLDGAKKSYILFNDVEENRERLKKGKVTTIQGVSDCDAYYFNVSGTDIVPEREFVFGKPDGRKQHNLGLFTISEYDREKNMLVTLKLENDGGDKLVKVVWLQPE